MGSLQKQDRLRSDTTTFPPSLPGRFLFWMIPVFLCLTGCDSLPQFPQWGSQKSRQLAEQSMAVGDFPQAVRYYETCLDGTEGTADVHYHLALIYDSKLNDPVSALHHYRRHLRMDPSSKFAGEVGQSISRIERSLAAKLNEGGLVPRSEAVRLRNENNQLREQIAALRGKPKTPATQQPPTDPKGFSKVPQTRQAEQVVGSETRTYTVKKGDTLASISRQFYKNSNRWKDIVDANHNQLGGGTGIREGQVLIIP